MKCLFMLIALPAFLVSCIDNSSPSHLDSAANIPKHLQSNPDTFSIENADILKRYAAPGDGQKFLTFEVDPGLHNAQVFKSLDSIPEIKEVFDTSKENQKRTADLKHYLTRKGYVNDSVNRYAIVNIGDIAIAKAFLEKGNILNIDLGFNDLFGASGFCLYIKDKRFTTMPYFSDDIIDLDEKEPLNYTYFQKLVLYKPRYDIGDSIWGYVAFSSIFYNEYGEPSRHNVAGYFRTEIRSRQD